MITEFKLENFKSFKGPVTTPFAPVTILCGANSSGKSSLIQALLLLKQTFESQTPARPLVLNSRFVRLGSFDTFVYGRDVSRPVTLGFTLELPERPSSTGRRRRNKASVPYEIFARALNFGVSEMELKRWRAEQVTVRRFIDVTLTLRGTTIQGLDSNQGLFVEQATYSSRCKVGASPEEHPGFRVSFSHQNSRTYMVSWSNFTTTLSRHAQIPPTGEHVAPMAFTNLRPEPLGPRRGALRNSGGEDVIDEAPNVFDLLYAMVELHYLVTRVFTTVSYIGPLREQPSRRYLYDEEVLEIGLKGENAPFILAAEGGEPVSAYYMPPNPGNSHWSEHNNVTLRQALESWLTYMEISPRIATELTRGILDVHLQASMTSPVRVSYADVGFGVSQILPILIEGLRQNPGETLILEQPEIHLHPRLELRLADFFIGMAKAGKRMVVETHSDHIINRLVRRIVEDDTNTLAHLINVVFVEPNSNGSVLRGVDVHPDKGIQNWPAGFFDQTADEQEAIIRAGIEKRSRKRRGN